MATCCAFLSLQLNERGRLSEQRAQTEDMKLLTQEDRRWFVAAMVFVVVGTALLLLPFETVPVLSETSLAGRIIGGLGVGIVLRSVVLVVLAHRQARASARRGA